MVRKIVLALIAVLVLAIGAFAGTWEADHAHSSINFSVSHMVIATVHGTFGDFDGTLDWDGKDIATGKTEFTIQTASISTNNERRDGHLKSPDFFDVEKYPTITFKSTKVILGEGKAFQLVGDLTIRDVTKSVTFDCTYNGTVDLGKMIKSGFSATTTINRQDYGVSWSKTLDNGGLVAGDDVTIELELEFNQAKPESDS